MSAEFAEWAAGRCRKFPGASTTSAASWEISLTGCARECRATALGERPCRRAANSSSARSHHRCRSRPRWTLSADWHEAVANNLDGPNSAFPDPWYPAAELGDYEILPIEDAASLYREGTAMHHCVGTYGDQVQRGDLYIYSIRRNGERVATLALLKHNGRVHLQQIRGACNTEPPRAIVAMVLRWLRAQQPLPMRRGARTHPIWTKEDGRH